jgi:hypothetical protein
MSTTFDKRILWVTERGSRVRQTACVTSKLVVVTAVVVLAGLSFFVIAGGLWRGDPLERCVYEHDVDTTNPAGRISYRWDWIPPGYVCEYRDRRGRVVEERRL